MNSKTEAHQQKSISKTEDQKIEDLFSNDKMLSFQSELRKEFKSGTKKSPRKYKCKGLTEKHKNEYNENRLKEYHDFKNIPQSDNFKTEILERVNGEILTDDIENFKELYHLTWTQILEDFQNKNPQLITKHPNMWYKPLLMEIKRNTPKVYADDLDKCIVVWDNIRELLNLIGLFMTYEAYRKVIGIDKKLFENRAELSPKYADFLQKIYNDCKDDLQSEILYSPYNSVNKIYMNKAVYGVVEKTEPKQLEVIHTIRDYDSLPMFENTEN